LLLDFRILFRDTDGTAYPIQRGGLVRRQSFKFRIFAACVCVGVAALVIGGVVRALEPEEIWFQLYSSQRGAAAMRPHVSGGPYRSKFDCYVAGITAIEILQTAIQDKNFAGRCTGDNDLMSAEDMMDRASAMIPVYRGK